MSTTEKPAETPYQPGDTIALNIPREPDRGTRLQDESGYVCENVGPDENDSAYVCWAWEDKTGKRILPRVTWMEVLSEATGALTILPPAFKVGDVITERAQLDLLPAGSSVKCEKPEEGLKASPDAWHITVVSEMFNADRISLPAKIIWLPENKEQA